MSFDIDDYIAYTENHLTPHRFKHSFGVMQVMGDLALIYDLDPARARIAGILHDIAKEFPLEHQLRFAGENKIALDTEHDRYPLFLHGPVGACYAAQEFGIDDPLILDAIARHSYVGSGDPQSPAFCWCLRFADMLEPSRDWEDLKSELKPLVYARQLGQAALALIRWIIPFHESTSLPVHPNIRTLAQELPTLENLNEINNLPV